MENTKYWFEDLSILTNPNNLSKIIPNKNLSHPEKINRLVRLSIYIGIILTLYFHNYLYLYIPILTIILTTTLYWFKDNKKKDEKKVENKNSIDIVESETKETFENNICSKPSLSNPFMNPMPFDDRKRSKACVENNENDIEKLYNHNLFKNVGDIYHNSNGQRQFYTVPSTTYPNNQGDFGKWLYGTPSTCKEGNGDQCVANNQTRLNAQSYKYPYIY